MRRLNLHVRGRGAILLVVHDFPSVDEPFVQRMFLGLLSRGCDVYMACSKINKRLIRQLLPEVQRRVICLPTPTSSCWRLFASEIAIVRLWGPIVALSERRRRRVDSPAAWRHGAAARAVLAVQPALVHFQFGSLAKGRIEEAAEWGIPHVVSFRGFDADVFGLESGNCYADVWRSARAIHAVSDEVAQRLRERGLPDGMPVFVIPPGIDVRRFDQPCRRYADGVGGMDRPFRILCVARLHWKKGHVHLLEAIRLLTDAGVSSEARFVGDGPFRDAVTFHRHRLGLQKIVELAGYAEPSEIVDHLRWGDVFVLPSITEGFSNAVVEAQASGLPVIVTDALGLRENVEDEVSGFLVRAGDPSALAERLGLLAANSSLRQQMGLAGAARARSKFQENAQLDALLEMYTSLGVIVGRQLRLAGDNRSLSAGTPQLQ